jgi:S-DNA-T family DNA segregation ATPase FtsK/SpoIIIE
MTTDERTPVDVPIGQTTHPIEDPIRPDPERIIDRHGSRLPDRRPAARALDRRSTAWWRPDGDGGWRYIVWGRIRRIDEPPTPRQPAGIAAGRAARRALYRIYRGHIIPTRRGFDALTFGVIREQIRHARTAGDQAALADWIDRLEQLRDSRRARIRDLPQIIASLAIAAAAGGAAVTVLLLGGGIAVVVTHPAGWGWNDWFTFWGGLVGTGMTVLVIGLRIGVWIAPLGWLLATWRAGRPIPGSEPTWMLAPALRAAETEPITPSLVVVALRDLGLARLRRSIQAMPDAGAAMLSTIRTAGCGVELEVRLPSGTSTDEIQARARKLAENLSRHEHELNISIPPEQARTVRLWVADTGALDEPVGPSPLLLDPDLTADYYTARAPLGPNLRGDPVGISLFQRHLTMTGQSNQGKTASLRSIALWLAQDPTVEFRIGDLKGVGDWRMFTGLATVLIQGPTEAHVIAVTEMLEAVVIEMQRRIVALEQSGATDGVTRDMAHAPGSGFHPIVALVDEAQVPFMCPAVDELKRPYGGTKANSRFFKASREILNQGRAVNVTLWLGTQDPTNANFPALIREAAHIRAAIKLGTEEQARMANGDPAVDNGAAPHKLRLDLDKGTLVISGSGIKFPPGQLYETIRGHYISGADGNTLAERAKARRRPALTDDGTFEDDNEPRDALADVEMVLGVEPRVLTQEVLARLRDLAPGVYGGWTFPDLTGLLAEWGAEPYKSDGRMVVGLSKVRAALTRRDQTGQGGGREAGRTPYPTP